MLFNQYHKTFHSRSYNLIIHLFSVFYLRNNHSEIEFMFDRETKIKIKEWTEQNSFSKEQLHDIINFHNNNWYSFSRAINPKQFETISCWQEINHPPLYQPDIQNQQECHTKINMRIFLVNKNLNEQRLSNLKCNTNTDMKSFYVVL